MIDPELYKRAMKALNFTVDPVKREAVQLALKLLADADAAVVEAERIMKSVIRDIELNRELQSVQQ